MRHCPYCAIEETAIIESCGSMVAIPCASPLTPGHTLIVPRRHFASFGERNEAEMKDLMILIHLVCSRLQQELSPKSFNAGFGDVDESGRRIEHFHLHLIPRRQDDGIDPSRLRTVSYGEERPFALGHEESAYSENRRVHFVKQ